MEESVQFTNELRVPILLSSAIIVCAPIQTLSDDYNRGRPHSSLGPGIPEPSAGIPALRRSDHRIPCGHRVIRRAVLGGLHHEYRLEEIAA
jgi:putative transposase